MKKQSKEILIYMINKMIQKPEDELVKKSFLYLVGIFIGILTGVVTLAFFSYLIFNFVLSIMFGIVTPSFLIFFVYFVVENFILLATRYILIYYRKKIE